MGERRRVSKGCAPRHERCANGKHGFSRSYFTAHVALYAPSRNELPDFSSSITTARVAGSFKLAPTGVLLKKVGVYSAKRNTGTEIGKFLISRQLYSRYLRPHFVCFLKSRAIETAKSSIAIAMNTSKTVVPNMSIATPQAACPAGEAQVAAAKNNANTRPTIPPSQ